MATEGAREATGHDCDVMETMQIDPRLWLRGEWSNGNGAWTIARCDTKANLNIEMCHRV